MSGDGTVAGGWWHRYTFIGTTVVLCLWVLVPIYFLFVNAISASSDVTAFPKPALPTIDLESLRFFANYQGVGRALWNSLLVAVVTMVIAIGIGAPAGYALSRFDFKGKGAFRLLVLLTRAFPLPLLALPLAILYIRIGLDDTVVGIAIVHALLAMPFAVLINFSLFSGVPVELEEAAWTLGCNRFQAFYKVILPLVLPGITASAIFAFVISWNEVFAAAVLTIEHRTLPAFLLQNLNSAPLHLKFAGGAMLVLPALLFIFLVRKYLFAMWGIANR